VPYAIGGASFIPLIGVIFGVVAIIWGITRRSLALTLLGICGILFTIVLYGTLYYFGFVQRGGVYDQLRSQLAVTMLNDAVKEVEFYKLQHNHYPAGIAELKANAGSNAFKLMDPTFIQRPGTKYLDFYYELDPSGSFYFLRSVGLDDIPFTNDDILPNLSEEDRKNTGLRLQR
jgi:hypothetical protein